MVEDSNKTKAELLDTVVRLRRHVRELEETANNTERETSGLTERDTDQLALCDFIRDFFFIVDSAGRIHHVNQVLLDRLRYTREELLGESISKLLPHEWHAATGVMISDVMAGRNDMYTTSLLTKEGISIPVGTAVMVRKWGDRDMLFYLSHDISVHQQKEDALRESEKKYKTLYHIIRLMCDNVPDLIWAKDLEKRFIFVNKAICDRLLNAKDTDEPVGKNDIFFAEREKKGHPDDPQWHTFSEICRDSDSVVMKTKKPQRFDETGNVKGEFLFLDVYKAPMFDEHGEIIGIVGCGRDVTKERYIERELRDSENRYRAIVEDQTELICRFLPDGTLSFVNDAYCRYFGKSREDLIGRSFIPLIPPDDHVIVQQQFASLSAENRVASCEHRVELPDGTIRWMSWTDRAIVDNEGTLIEYQSVGRDITERKHMEEALQRVNEELDRRVKDRTAELSIANEKLCEEIEERKHVQEQLDSQRRNLEEMNVALRILLEKRDENRQVLEEKVLRNVKELVLPYLERLKRYELDCRQKVCLGIVESNLRDIISPFLQNLSPRFVNLSPAEGQVANLIKNGQSTKEIAEVMNLSRKTIETHRKNIRKKIGLTNKKINLITHLMSMK